MNDYIKQLQEYRDDGIAPSEIWLQRMLQGRDSTAFIYATPETITDMQQAHVWMMLEIPLESRGCNYERYLASFHLTLEGNPNVL